jgi:Fur family peroxide stress response transcriptional regulator
MERPSRHFFLDLPMHVLKEPLDRYPEGHYTSLIRNDSALSKISKESIIEQLKEKGLRITPQRLAIIDVLLELKPLHPGARLVYEEAKRKKESLSLSTVYATLNEFSRHGIIKTLQFDRMENRYEGNREEHLNLICEKCNKIVDYIAPLAVNKREIEKNTGFSITDARLEYYGICRECDLRGPAGEGLIPGKRQGKGAGKQHTKRRS